MTVVDEWYSAALVVKYTVGGFRHYLFFPAERSFSSSSLM